MNKGIKYDINLILNNLVSAIEQSGLSYGEISRRTGIPKSSIHRYAQGETKKIPIDAVRLIADSVGVPTSQIMGWEEDKTPSPNTTKDFTTYAVIGEIAAGYDHIAAEDWDGEKIDVPTSYLKGRNKEDFFVLKVKGDSMFPTYQDGDKVLVLRQTTLNYSGQVGVILYNNELATLKKVEYINGENWLRMVAINPSYPSKKIEGEELQGCQILGIPKLLIREIDV